MENKNNALYGYITHGNKMQAKKFYMQGRHETDTGRQNNQVEMIWDLGYMYMLYMEYPLISAGNGENEPAVKMVLSVWFHYLEERFFLVRKISSKSFACL